MISFSAFENEKIASNISYSWSQKEKWERNIYSKCENRAHELKFHGLEHISIHRQEMSIFDLQSGSYSGLIGLCLSFPTTSDFSYPLPKTWEEQYTFTKQNYNRKKNCNHKWWWRIPDELVSINPLIPSKHQCMNSA